MLGVDPILSPSVFVGFFVFTLIFKFGPCCHFIANAVVHGVHLQGD